MRSGILLFLVGLGASPSVAVAATVVAGSCERAAVQAAMDAATSGDTVVLPACGCTEAAVWASRIDITKAVVIQGQGVGSTCIRDYGFLGVAGVNDWRITGIRFQQETAVVTKPLLIGVQVHEGTPVTGWAIDGNSFYGYAAAVEVFNGSTGLIANNYIEASDSTISNEGIYIYGSNSADWASSLGWGDAGRYVFIEDNHFFCAGSKCGHVILGGWGGSYVARCNKIESQSITNKWADAIDVHGYGHGTGIRSGRQVEIYGNLFIQKGNESRAMNLRGGTGRIFANRWQMTSQYGFNAIQFTDYRMIATGLAMAYPTSASVCSSNTASCLGADEATCCADHEGYACCDQIGTGQDLDGSGGLRQQSVPAYLWDNKATTGADVSVGVAAGAAATYIQSGRDYISGEIPVGYRPYTYPHPARSLSTTTICLSDTSSNAKTGITFFAPAATFPAAPQGLRLLTP